MEAIVEKNVGEAPAIDIFTLATELEKRGQIDQIGGVEYLSELMAAVVSAANVKHYAKVVREKAMWRKLIRLGMKMTGIAANEPADPYKFMEEIEEDLYKLWQDRMGSDVKSASKLVTEAIQKIEEFDNYQGDIIGIPTGYYKLDKKTSGFQGGQLIILAARPGIGKTSLALNMAINAARYNEENPFSVAIFSLEMTNLELMIRMLCSMAKVDSQQFRRGRLSDDEWMRLSGVAGKLRKTKVFIDDTPGLSIGALRSKSMRLKKMRDGLDMIVVDYLQLMDVQSSSEKSNFKREIPRHEAIAKISRTMKALAKELDVPIIALSQLNREVDKRQDKKPNLSDLRESGSIEQDADIIMFINRETNGEIMEDEAERVELMVAKHRAGPTGPIHLRYTPKFTLFENLAEDDEVPD